MKERNFLDIFFHIWIKFFFLLTPFFSMSVFLSLTKEMDNTEKYKISVRVTFSVIIVSSILYFFGNEIFNIFGITLDSFRIGAGSLLFISSVQMVQGSSVPQLNLKNKDIAVVPLAIPITVGPATTGALLVLGAEVTNSWEKFIGYMALIAASTCVGFLLIVSAQVQRIIGYNGLTILEKLTGLILSALASQIVFTGIKNFLSTGIIN